MIEWLVLAVLVGPLAVNLIWRLFGPLLREVWRDRVGHYRRTSRS